MPLPVDPAFLLAAACCRWPPDPAAVRAAAVGVDWERFAHVVQRQRIAGLVDPALRGAQVTPPRCVAASIAESARRTVHQNLVAVAETARLVTLIADTGQRVLAIKGVVLGALAYGSVGLKHSKDIDLLVMPESVGAILDLLERDGYRLALPAERLSEAQRHSLTRYGKDVALVNARGHQIELHWRLFDSRAVLPGITAASPTQNVALGGQRSAPTLAQPDLYVYLVQHGATDGWSRLKWLADVNALLAPLDAVAVGTLHAHAVALGAGAASAQALLLMHDLFARPLPTGLAETLGRSRRVRWLVAGAYRMMAPKDGMREIGDWWGGQLLALAMQPLLQRGLPHTGQVLRSVLYQPTAMYAGPVPPVLYPLYPLIRVPAWAWRRGSQGLAWLLQRGKSATSAPKSS